MRLPPNNWVINTPDGDCDLDMDSIRVILFCTPRSGSTLLYQILRLMFPDVGILWTHQFIPPPAHAWLIISHRDVRDCIASHCRHRLPDLENITPGHMRFLAGWFWQFGAIAEAYGDWSATYNRPPLATITINYREHDGDPRRAYALLQALCPRIDVSEVSEADLTALGRDKQRPIVDSGNSDVMQPGHIGTGESGSYRGAFSAECIELAEAILYPRTTWIT